MNAARSLIRKKQQQHSRAPLDEMLHRLEYILFWMRLLSLLLEKQQDDENKECNRVLLFVATRYATYTEHVSQKLLEAYRQPNQDQVGGLCYSRRLLLYIAAEAGSSSPCSYIVGRQPKKSILSQTLEACTRCKDWDGWYCLDRFDALL